MLATDVAEENGIPREFELFQNYPNPFNPSTVIRFALPSDESVTLRVYDILGREVRTLLAGDLYTAGEHSTQWFGRDDTGTPVANGVYIYRIQAGNHTMSRRMVLLR